MQRLRERLEINGRVQEQASWVVSEEKHSRDLQSTFCFSPIAADSTAEDVTYNVWVESSSSDQAICIFTTKLR